MKKIFLILILITFSKISLASSIFDDLKHTKKTSYLDFVILKLENRLIQRHGLLGTQFIALRIQYESVGSQVDFSEEENKIFISIIGVMDKKRYKEKKYKPKISDCNIIRNILLYGKYGYNMVFQKRNIFLTNTDMEEIFISRFLNNLTLSDKEKEFILENTYAKVQIIDPIRGYNITGSILGLSVKVIDAD